MQIVGYEIVEKSAEKNIKDSKKINFRATAMLYGASAPEKTLGCIEFTFKLDTC